MLLFQVVGGKGLGKKCEHSAAIQYSTHTHTAQCTNYIYTIIHVPRRMSPDVKGSSSGSPSSTKHTCTQRTVTHSVELLLRVLLGSNFAVQK